jgi:hypothetical protein
VPTPVDSNEQRKIRSGYTGPKNNSGEPDTTGTDEIGVMKYPPNDVYYKRYSGQWRNGEFYGQGTLINTNGDTYTGEFIDGAKNGRGVYKHSNGMVREGEFENERHVRGKLIRPDYTFQGTFVNEKPRTGTFTYNDGSVFTGTCESETTQVGTFRYPDGDIFSGTFKDWTLNGDDAEMIVNSRPIKFTYKGQMRNGVRHGHGTMQFMSGPLMGVTYSARFNMDQEVSGSTRGVKSELLNWLAELNSAPKPPTPKGEGEANQGGTRHKRTRCRRKRLRMSKRDRKRC